MFESGANKNKQKFLSEELSKNYWKANLKLLFSLLFVWFIVSFGCGILWADWLDQFTFFGFNLGFWFAQQGSIYIFVVLIFIYSWRISRLEKKMGVDELGDDSQKNISKETSSFE